MAKPPETCKHCGAMTYLQYVCKDLTEVRRCPSCKRHLELVPDHMGNYQRRSRQTDERTAVAKLVGSTFARRIAGSLLHDKARPR